ncbi:tRNA pseudouridine synthase A [Pleomorphovibrio marinus]|uniref:tRNA pseudouridine synthase A n=1 Tax=Pleomorphovibrio marinus TaxID=2164132 RepID=UPI000E0B2E43|nr:tRNA pseudouridine(38-40) synthase TruA [Pleomorphovibrio marinus]
MKSRPYCYLFRIQYLGLRYHGWQVQKGVKTIQGVLERAIRFTLGNSDFAVLGASRTDSGVSSLDGAFALYTKEPLDINEFIPKANKSLPSDVKLLNATTSPENFNIIQDVEKKRYGYYFTFGEKPHPFYMGYLAYAGLHLEMDSLKEAARSFEGRHDFRRFCTQGKNITDFVREISTFQVLKEYPKWCPNADFPVYVLRVEGPGFLMHQIRRMAYALWMVGWGELKVNDIATALGDLEKHPLSPKAPAQGLVLENLTFKGNLF